MNIKRIFLCSCSDSEHDFVDFAVNNSKSSNAYISLSEMNDEEMDGIGASSRNINVDYS
jgi:hypothetical protein